MLAPYTACQKTSLWETDSPDTGEVALAPEGERWPEGPEGESLAFSRNLRACVKRSPPPPAGGAPLPEGAKEFFDNLSRGEQCSPLQILRYFLSFFSSSRYAASSSMSASVRASVSARAATKLRGLPPNRRCHTLLLSAGRYSLRVKVAV